MIFLRCESRCSEQSRQGYGNYSFHREHKTLSLGFSSNEALTDTLPEDVFSEARGIAISASHPVSMSLSSVSVPPYELTAVTDLSDEENMTGPTFTFKEADDDEEEPTATVI